jgi:hypothetical protein
MFSTIISHLFQARLGCSVYPSFKFLEKTRHFLGVVGIYSKITIETMETKNYKRTSREMPEYVKAKLRANANLHKPKSPETRAKISAGLKLAWASVPPKSGSSIDAGGTTIKDIMLEIIESDGQE